ncbi:MAG TPA: sigma-70 family RNA polymerase sigma factor [Candidatus Acidoferrales bacterium]|nr:sigma-70 family RNA polymerase sigma factor [Candidatus Acidoferrales bacterium]
MIAVARDGTIAAYHYLCRRGARKFLRSGLERCDLEQVAAIGLIKAYDRYDSSLQTPFEAYAWMMIVGELMHHVRDHAQIVRVPRWLRSLERRAAGARERLTAALEREPSDAELAAELGIPVTLVTQLRSGYSDLRYEQALAEQRQTVCVEDRILLSRAIGTLDHVQQKIVLGIYGLGMTQTELARQIGYSTRHVSRLHQHALQTVRCRLAETHPETTQHRQPSSRYRTVKRRAHEEGFTLLELMVVVAIIAIIASILMPNFFHARAQAAVSACESNIRAISTAAELYYSDNQAYPPSVSPVTSSFGTGSGSGGTVTVPPGTYLSQTPKDAVNSVNNSPGQYTYTLNTNGGTQSYTIECNGVHDSTALQQIPGSPTGMKYVLYNSLTGFTATDTSSQ